MVTKNVSFLLASTEVSSSAVLLTIRLTHALALLINIQRHITPIRPARTLITLMLNRTD